MKALDDPWTKLSKPCRRLGLLLAVAGSLAASLVAEPASKAPEVLPTGTAHLTLEGRPVATVSTALPAGGPLFVLAPIAAVLGAELRIGPLGDSHTLIFDDRQIIIGPGQPTLVTVAPDGRTRREVVRLAQTPIRDRQGLKVSREVLEKALGEPLNYQFSWDESTATLDISRPELRLLRGTVTLRHQYQISMVEIELSEAPRYRVERTPEALEIQLVGDRFETPIQIPPQADPFVENVIVLPDRLRLELADGVIADEPRLLLTPRARLVIEVFEGAVSRPEVAEVPRRTRRRAPGVRTIVLDPGHGGTETGAVGPGGVAEAELALRVAKALRLQLERRLPIRVVMTRETDADVSLETRTAIANQNQADLFVSLHFNSSFGAQAHGAETYFLSREASDQLAADFAAKENAAASTEPDPELGLQMILWDLAQSYHLGESQRFATLVQEELNLALGLRDRGVRQAPFTVLMGARMPAVLVELGFLSNPEEEEKLQSPVYRAELVDALVRAITRFKRQVEDQYASGREGSSEGLSSGEAAGAKGTP